MPYGTGFVPNGAGNYEAKGQSDGEEVMSGTRLLLTGARNLQGIQRPVQKSTLVEQIVESIRRIQYVSVIRQRHISPLRADPDSELFDPIKGAILFDQAGHFEDACWMVFVFVHFGKHRRAGVCVRRRPQG